MILHELAHAYHDQVLGFDDPGILKAYNQAMKKGIYEKCLLFNGQHVKHYATTDHKEYFAVATEAYFHKNYFHPFARAALELHDPLGYSQMKRGVGACGIDGIVIQEPEAPVTVLAALFRAGSGHRFRRAV